MLDEALQNFVDGRLPIHHRIAVESYLATDPDAAERVAAYLRQNTQLKRLESAALFEAIPEQLLDILRKASSH